MVSGQPDFTSAANVDADTGNVSERSMNNPAAVLALPDRLVVGEYNGDRYIIFMSK